MPDSTSVRSRYWRIAAFGSIGLLVVAAGLLATLRHLDGEYGPITSGGFGGPYSQRNLDSVDEFNLRLATGPNATAQLITSLANQGAHSVKVSSVDSENAVVSVTWSTYRTVPGGDISGVAAPWHTFPATVPAHGQIRLLITIHRPSSCDHPQIAGSQASSYSGLHRVHWRSLLSAHTTTVDDGITNIRLC